MKNNLLKNTINFLFLLLIAVGIFFRFQGMDWNSGANLHPDEYGLTNTLTQLSFPRSPDEYFNTRLSPISPYNKYDVSGQHVRDGPDNRLRWGQWPVILIRAAAELTGQTGYDELRVMGRYLSAVFDSLTVLLIFLIGRRLYGTQVGLLGAAFSSLAVMQIQQSHFMTVDNYAVFFTAFTMYWAVRIAQTPPLFRKAGDDPGASAPYRANREVIRLYLLNGAGLGMALASKINLLPLAGMVLIAAFVSIADLKLKTSADIKKIFLTAALLVAASYVTAAVTFRITQPMSFRAPSGDTSPLTLHLNPDWVDSMKVSMAESNGEGGGPPAEQWADRPIILFPLMNMVVWGMGIFLGMASWYGWGKAAWQILRGLPDWRQHVLPVAWAGGFFVFMATRWVKSIRYFLPIYPFLCLLAAWGLLSLVYHSKSAAHPRIEKRRIAAGLLLFVVILGTLAWASAFTRAVYGQPNTRIQATRWVLANVPAPIHIQLSSGGRTEALLVSIPDGTTINSSAPFQQRLNPQNEGTLENVILPHVLNRSTQPVRMTITLSHDAAGGEIIDEVTLEVPPSKEERGEELRGAFSGARISAGREYFLTASTDSTGGLVIFQNTIASEDWDEGLPVPLDGYNPYGGLYRGVTMPVRWTDDDAKRDTMLDNLEQVDYIILSSQRGLWSVPRLQKMYPMTIHYYRTLFDGRLGFERAASFQAPWRIGPLQISDVGGTAAWGQPPALPVFNFNFFAAEEAFSVYDHAPVWIFKKGEDYSGENAAAILGAVDLSQAGYQSPYETDVVPFD